jgi:phage shock protein C
MEKRIYRSKTNKIIGGVCGGIGEYFGVDPVLIRLLWVGATFLAGAGILFYIIAWIVIPEDTRSVTNTRDNATSSEDPTASSETGTAGSAFNNGTSAPIDSKKGALIVAILFMFFGAFLLLNRFWAIFSWKVFFGLFFVLVGGLLLYGFFKGVKK